MRLSNARHGERDGLRFVLFRHHILNVRPFFIGVNEPLTAYQDLAAFHRSQFSIPVVAITGSNGKTTTKEMVSHTLAGQMASSEDPGKLQQ